jgi:predicted nucleotidyltransferase
LSGLGFLRELNRELVSDEERESRIARTCSAIVSVVSPKLIFVFGSAVSSEKFDSDSDIDVLIVVEQEEQASRFWKLFGKIRRQVSWPLDIVCLSESEFTRKRDLGGIAFIATHEGKLVYEKTPQKPLALGS